MSLPLDNIAKKMARGGKITNEDGLIYDVQMNNKQDLKLVSVGFEYAQSAPTLCYFSFDLSQKKDD